MAINLNQDLLTSVLSNYHTFIPKLTLTDRARVKEIVSPNIDELPFEYSTCILDEEEITSPHLFSAISYNNKDYIFACSKLENIEAEHESGPEYNEIMLVTRDGNEISEVSTLDLTFNVDVISCFEVYYNSTCGQFGLVYGGYSYENDRWRSKLYLKRLMLIPESDDYTITQYDETLLDYGISFFTASCLDDGNLIIMAKARDEYTKKCFEINLFDEEVNAIESEDNANGEIRNLKSCCVNGQFYYIEVIKCGNYYQTNLYDSHVFGYTPSVSDNLFNCIANTNGNLTYTSSPEDGTYTIHKSNGLSINIAENIPINDCDDNAIFNVCNYLMFNNFVVFEYNGEMFIQGTDYAISYQESNTEITLPAERIIKVEFESVSDNLKSRAINITLNNDDGFFTDYGETEDHFDYKNFFNSTRTSLRKIKFFIGDNSARDAQEKVEYEVLYTGFLNNVTDDYKGRIVVQCVDGLEIMKRAIAKEKTYSMWNGDDYIKDLCRQAGFTDLRFDTSTNYTITKVELDRRQNILDAIKKVLDICNLQMYIDRFGTVVITERSMYHENIYNISDRHILDIQSLEEPSTEYVRNVVRIITDAESDSYVEARDEEAIVDMGYEAVMELDYSGLFSESAKSKISKYTYPTDIEVIDALKKVSPVLATNPTAVMFCKSSCGKFPYHARYLYALKIFFYDEPEVWLVSCENKLNFTVSGYDIYAYAPSFSTACGINVYGRNSWNHGYLNRTDGMIPNFNTPGYGYNLTGIGNDPGGTGARARIIDAIQIFPNKEYFPEEQYQDFPQRTYMNFRKDLINHLVLNCGLSLSDADKTKINSFIATFDKPGYEMFYYTKSGGSYQPGILSQSILPCYFWDLVAVKKDYTYFSDVPELITEVVRRADGRISKIVPKDGANKEFMSIKKWQTPEERWVSQAYYSLDDYNDYGLRDIRWHRVDDAENNGISAKTVADRILKQVCRTVEFDTIKTVPLFFLTPEDIVYLNISRAQGYRQIKSIKHTFIFDNTTSKLYECTLRLQDAIENVDFILLETPEEEVSE